MLVVLESASFRGISRVLGPVDLVRYGVGVLVSTTEDCDFGSSKSPKSSSFCAVDEGSWGTCGAREWRSASVGGWVGHSGSLERVGCTSPQTSCCKA